MTRALAVALLTLLASSAAAVEPLAIQDNSFLIEEAYNQERGVVQHIFTLTRGVNTFTQEWPAGGQTHQFSYTAPFGHGAGDVLINYRYQLVGSGESRIAVAPRISAILPTANHRGVDVNLPVSVAMSNRVVTHWNAGATAVRGARTAWSGGASVIWAAWPLVHFMVENRWSSDAKWTVAPGIRWAHNLAHNLQIVPGVALPLSANHRRAVFAYLSFEHPFTR